VESIRKTSSVLTVAGVDSGGGAGVAADLKTFAALKVHGACAITALTAQNTRHVYEVHPVPPSFLRRQLEAVFADLDIRAVKVGMLYTPETVRTVAEALRGKRLLVVVDPVLRAAVGEPLAIQGVVEAYIEEIFPLATVVTPNVPEAEALTGFEINNLEDMKAAAAKLHNLGAENILLKGGHLRGDTVIDLLSQRRGGYEKFEGPRIEGDFHGLGCTLSSALTAYLAQSHPLPQAFRKSEEFIRRVLVFSKPVGEGLRVADPLIPLYNAAEEHTVVESVYNGLKIIQAHQEDFLCHIAEVGTQIAMALPYPLAPEDVAAVEGRLHREGQTLRIGGSVKFGVSSHMARVILTCIRHDLTIRAAMNLHYDGGLLKAFEEAGLTASTFDRRLEPAEVKRIEGATLSWGVEQAIRAAGRVTDLIYDLGDRDREPMIRILGRDAEEVVEKALKGARGLRR